MTLGRLEHRGGGAAVDARHHVDAVIRDRIVLEIPAEQRAIEALGRLGVGGGEVRPGEGAVLVAVAFAHAPTVPAMREGEVRGVRGGGP